MVMAEADQVEDRNLVVGGGTARGSGSAQDGQGVGTGVLAREIVADERDHAVHERLRRPDLQHDGRRYAHHGTPQRYLHYELWYVSSPPVPLHPAKTSPISREGEREVQLN